MPQYAVLIFQINVVLCFVYMTLSGYLHMFGLYVGKYLHSSPKARFY
jgi:hypothetical protein